MFLFLCIFAGLAAATNVTISTVSSSTVMNYGPAGDKCFKLIAESAGVYHLSTERVYQSWLKGALTTPLDLLNVTAASTVHDFDVNALEEKVYFMT